MKELMDNPYAWLILSLCTVFSLLFAIYTWIVGKKNKEISMDYSCNEIIKQGRNPIPKLNIAFDDKEIQDLTSTAMYIWNSGNDVVNINDVVGKVLKIKCKSEVILDVQIISQSDESNKFAVVDFSAMEAIIGFDYIDKGEGVRLQILHTNMSNEDFCIECKIKGGKEIRNCFALKTSKGIRGIWRACRQDIIPMAIIMLSMYLSTVIFPALNISSSLSLFFSVLLAFVVTLLVLILSNKLKRTFHRTIPVNLKK